MKKKIKPAQRRHQDELRRNGLNVGAVYENKLIKLRAAEVRRCLELARNFDSEEAVIMCLQRLDESKYLPAWYSGLYRNAGLPMAESTAQDMRVAKAGGFVESDAWLSSIDSYARNRAGSEIVLVSGTLKDSLVNITRRLMDADLGLGVEKLTKRIYSEFRGLTRWQCRRIAQTETMIALGESANIAAQTLDVKFTKQWCISGLGNTRESHEAMDGVIIDQDDYFELEGGRLLFPHDTSMNPDASEIINCACACIREPKMGEAPTAPEPVAEPEPIAPAEPDAVDAEEQRLQEMINELPDGMSDEEKRAIAQNNIEMEKALGMQKGAPMSVDEADKMNANPDYSTGSQFKINCATCSPAYVMRTRGFDVTAAGNPGQAGNPVTQLARGHCWDKWLTKGGAQASHVSLEQWARDRKIKRLTPKKYFEFYDSQTKTPGIYEVSVAWRGGGGHSTILQRFEDGRLMRIDAQNGYQAEFTEKDSICSYSACSVDRIWSGRGIMRVDDKLFNLKFAKIFNRKKK